MTHKLPPPVFGIIPSGGGSSRFGGKKSKLLARIAGRPVIQWTVQSLLHSYPFEKIVIPCPKNEIQEFRFLAELSPKITIIEGGDSRAASVREGLLKLPEDPESLVLIHDGARCGISKDEIQAVIEASREYKAASLALPVTDTVKRVHNDRLETIDREGLWAMQTPQVFMKSIIEEGFKRAKNLQAITDDVALVESFHPVKLILGSKWNIKLTTPEDALLLEKILSARSL